MTNIEYIQKYNYSFQRRSYTKINKGRNIYYILCITSLERKDGYANRYKVKYNFSESLGAHQRFIQSEIDEAAPNIVLNLSNDETHSSG